MTGPDLTVHQIRHGDSQRSVGHWEVLQYAPRLCLGVVCPIEANDITIVMKFVLRLACDVGAESARMRSVECVDLSIVGLRAAPFQERAGLRIVHSFDQHKAGQL